MPFVSFSTYSQDPNDQKNWKKYKELKDLYKGQTIHGSATLDEFYYHFTSTDKKDEETEEDKEAKKDRDLRNCNQVVTKILQPNKEQLQLHCWPLVQVNQIWIWTIADSM